MARPRKAESERTEGELLVAAARAFGAEGLDGARLEDIARSAGVRRSSLLYHYPSKEALYEAVVRDGFGGLGVRLAGALARPGTPREAVAAVVREFRRFLDARPELARVLVRELLSRDGPARQILLDEVVPLLDLVERGLSGRALRAPRASKAAAGGFPPRSHRTAPAGGSVREAVLTVAASMLLRRASGDLGRLLWGARDGSERLAAALLLGSERKGEGKS